MKKDRNTFFQTASMSSQNVMPNFPTQQPFINPYYNQMNPQIQASQASQSFYAGPDPSLNNQNSYINNSNNYFDDLENHLSKIERQLNRLDSRITKLENNLNLNLSDNDYSSKMYMV